MSLFNFSHPDDSTVPFYQDGNKFTGVGGFIYAICSSDGVYLAMIKDQDNNLKGRFFTVMDSVVTVVKDIDASGIMSLYHSGWDVHFNRTADKLVVCRNSVYFDVSGKTVYDNDIREYAVSFKDHTIQLSQVVFAGIQDLDRASFAGYDKHNQLCYCYWNSKWITNNGDYLPPTGFLLGVFPQYKASYYLTDITSNIYHENDAYRRDHWNSTHHVIINNYHVQATYSGGVMTKDITWSEATPAANSQIDWARRESGGGLMVGVMPIVDDDYSYLHIIEDRFNNLHVLMPPFSFYVSANGSVRDDSKTDEFYHAYNTNHATSARALSSVQISGVI